MPTTGNDPTQNVSQAAAVEKPCYKLAVALSHADYIDQR